MLKFSPDIHFISNKEELILNKSCYSKQKLELTLNISVISFIIRKKIIVLVYLSHYYYPGEYIDYKIKYDIDI